MRTFVTIISALILLSVMNGEASACRGPFRSNREVIQVFSTIFTAKVTSRTLAKGGAYLVELHVMETIKGAAHGSLTVPENALIHPNDKCTSIESGKPLPQLESGEEWLVSGHFDESKGFVPTLAGSFRLTYADGKAVNDRNRLLGDFRKTIARKPKRSKSAAQWRLKTATRNG